MRLPTGPFARRGGTVAPPPPAATTSSLESAAKVEARLHTMLELVNGWLQFAETKNAGLVALNALGLTGILEFLAHREDVPRGVVVGLMVTSALLLLSLGTSLLSFLPRGDPRKLVPKTGQLPTGMDNFYFYGDLSKYQPELLAGAVATQYEGMRDYVPARHRSHLDLANQIIANSRITVAKNAYFRVATALALLALAGALVSSLLAALEQR